MLTLNCLGDLRLERDGEALLSGRRKPLALLAFLARRSERPSSREQLAALLWGSSDDASARKSLRQCLSELRASNVEFSETDAGVVIAADTIVTDAGQFEIDIRSGRWEQALDRWRGDFIAGGESLGDDAWQTWLNGERAGLARQLAMACEQLTASAEQRGEWREVIAAARRWRSALPDDGRAWTREIHALQASGRLTEAIARVAEAEHHFRDDLAVGVPDDVARLGRVLGRLQQVAGGPAASLLTPDLVGRGETLAAMARARVQARITTHNGPGALLVAAGEGRGKTRLLREFARQTRESDPRATIIEVAAFPSDRNRPYSFCQGVIARIASHDALAACAPETLGTLAHIAPGLREYFRHVPSVEAPTPGAIAASFSRALTEVASVSPVVMIFDDFPESDAESLTILAPLLLHPPARTLIVAAGRPESWQRSLVSADLLNRGDPANRMSIEPLRPDETRALISSMVPLAPATLQSLTTTLHDLSGGIPGLLTSLMAHQVTTGALSRSDSGEWSSGTTPRDQAATPSDLEDRWRARYGQFSLDAQRVVDAMAVLGSGDSRTAYVVDLERVAHLDPVRFRGAIDELLAAGVMQRAGDTVSFVADVNRLLAFRALPPSTRMALHARAARRLRAGTRWPTSRGQVEYHRRASGSGRRKPAGAIAVVGVLLVAVVAWYGSRKSAATVNAGTPVLLADVENRTGDSAFDRTLFLAASVGLQQSRQISLFPRSRIRETLALMQRQGADSVLDEALAREIAIRENLSRVILLGVTRVDSLYMVTARIVDPASDRVLFAGQERAANPVGVLEQLDKLLNQVRRASGEPVDSLRAYSVPLPRVTTTSLAALRAYAAGTDAWTKRRYAEAIAGYRRAVELDSAFALAWLGLAEASFQVGQDRAGADAALSQALRHTDRLTERERLRVQRTTAGIRGLAEAELRIAEQLARRFPERETWYSVGTLLMRMRRCPEAIAALGQSIAFDSTFSGAHINVATCHQFLGAPDSAVAAYNRAYAVDSGSVYTGGLNHEFGVALVRAGLLDSARRVYTRMAGRTQAFDRQFGQRSLAYLAAWLGRSREADAHFDSAAALAAEMRQPLSEFRNRILQSEHRLTIGTRERANASLDAATRLSSGLSLDPAFAMYAGLAYIRAGQVRSASRMIERIQASSRAASASDRTSYAVLAARIALARGDPREARRELQSATDTTRSDYILSTLVDAYIALGHADSALDASVRLADRATFGTDAQDLWLRNLIRLAQLSERLGQPAAARAAFTRAELQLASGDTDHPLRLEARRGIARLAGRDARETLPVRPPPRQ